MKLKYKSQYNWKKRNPEKVNKMAKGYRERHKTEIKECHKKWRDKNREKIRGYQRKWRTKYTFKWRVKRACKNCKKDFIPIHFPQLYCSKECSKQGKGSLKLRFQILLRDNFTCQYCGRKAPDVILQVDHKYPKSKGGKLTENNLIIACLECNQGKKDILLN